MADYEKMYREAFDALVDAHAYLIDSSGAMLQASIHLIDLRMDNLHAERLVIQELQKYEAMCINKEDEPTEPNQKRLSVPLVGSHFSCRKIGRRKK